MREESEKQLYDVKANLRRNFMLEKKAIQVRLHNECINMRSEYHKGLTEIKKFREEPIL